MKNFEIRAIDTDGSLKLEIRVNAYNWSERIKVGSKMFREQWDKQAFEKATSKGNEIELWLNHDKKRGAIGKIIGSEVRENGWYVQAELNEEYRYLYDKAKKGWLNGISFGFVCLDDIWNETNTERKVKDAEIREVSILDGKRPAYRATSIEARSEDSEVIEQREFIDFKNTIEYRDILRKKLNLRVA